MLSSYDDNAEKIIRMDFHIYKVADNVFLIFISLQPTPPSSILRLSECLSRDAGEKFRHVEQWYVLSFAPPHSALCSASPHSLTLHRFSSSAPPPDLPPRPLQHTSIFLQSPGTELAEQKFSYYGRMKEYGGAQGSCSCVRARMSLCYHPWRGNEGIGC